MACPSISGLGTGVYSQIEGRLDRIDQISNSALADLKTALLALEHAGRSAINEIDTLPDVQSIPLVNAQLTLPNSVRDFVSTPAPIAAVSAYQSDYAPESLTANLGAAPTFTDVQPVLNAPERPNRARPANAPAPPTAPTIPAAPEPPTDLVLGPAPSLYQPKPVALLTPDIARMTAMIEALLAKLPDGGGVSDVNNQLIAAAESFLPDIDAWMVGKLDKPAIDWQEPLNRILAAPYDRLGLPAAVEDALRGRVMDAEDRNAAQAESQVRSEWLARGFTLPGGILEAKIAAVRNEAWSKKSAANRDIYTETAKLAATQLIEAIKIGADLEMKYWDAYGRLIGVIAGALQSRLDAFGRVLSSLLEALKLAFTGPDLLAKLEMAKSDINKGALENERLQVESSSLAMQSYKTQADIVTTRAAHYESRVRAFTAQIQSIGLIYEQYKSEVQAFTADIQAFLAEWDAYGKEWAGEQSRQDAWKSAASAFAERVRARNLEIDAKKTEEGFKVEIEKLHQQTWALELEEIKTRLQLWAETERTRLDAHKTQQQDAAFELEKRKLAVDVELKNADINARNSATEMEIKLKRADLQIQKSLEISKMLMGVYDALSRAAAQLVAGAMSAMNLSASISSGSSTSNSVGCTTSYSYQE